MKLLIIVDMQSLFSASSDPALISGIEKAAASTVNGGGVVLQVGTDGCGEFVTTNLPQGVQTIWKKNDGGGDEVYSWLVGAGIINSALEVEVCGVNTSLCVFQTAMGISDRLGRECGIIDRVTINLSLCGDRGMPRVKFRQS